jgi:WD40 repeat protein
MERSYIRPGRTLLVVLMAVVLAGCVTPASPSSQPPDASPGSSAVSIPGTTATTGPSATPTPLPSTPTPTATPTPIPPQPVSFSNASQLQILGEAENFDQNWKLFSYALSPDGQQAAVAGCLLEGDDNACHGTTFFRLFDVQSGAALLDPQYLSPAIQVLAFSPDGRVLAAAGCDINLWIYGEMDTLCDLPRAWLIDTATGQVIAELTGNTSHVTDFAFTPDSATLFTSVTYFRNDGDGDHVIRAYDTHTGEKLATIETGMINCTDMYLDISPDGRYLVGNVSSRCETQSFVAWWDVRDPRHPVKVGNVESYRSSRVSPDSTQILVFNPKDLTLKLYDLETGSPIELLPSVPMQRSLRRFTYLNNRDTLLFDFYDEYDVFDIPSGEIVHRILPPQGGSFSGYLLTPDRASLFVMSMSGTTSVEVWDLTTWQSLPLSIDPDNGWFLQEFSNSSPVAFLPGATAFVGIDVFYGSMRSQIWGVADAGQAQAAQALRDYFDLLVSGEVEKAAQMYIDQGSVQTAVGDYVPVYIEYPVSYIETQLPGTDFGDLPAVFSSLCQEADFPCMPVRDILYPAKLAEGLYRFTVTFALPDGTLADWPPCSSLPASNYCWHRGGLFEYFVYRAPDGNFQVVEGLPPAVGLLVEQ